MKLYSGPLSLFSRKVEIALGEKGLAFERVMVAFTQERGYQPKHPDVLAANPKGQVPVLVDGDLTLFDSTLIFEYLEEAYPTPALLPPMGPGAAKARARCRMMELRADEVVFPHARLKIFLTASPEVRAERRHKQLMEKGLGANIQTLLQEIRQRDARDSARTAAPLKPAADAVILDTTGLCIQQVVDRVLLLWQDRK